MGGILLFGKNQASETFYSELIKCQSPCQLQNLRILLIPRGHKNPCEQNFFIPKDKVINITSTITLGKHHLHT